MSDFTNNTPADNSAEIDLDEALSFFDTAQDLTGLEDPFAAIPAGIYQALLKVTKVVKNSTEKGVSATASMTWSITGVQKLDTPIDDPERLEALIGRSVTGSVNSKMVGAAKQIWIDMATKWLGGSLDEIKENHVNPAKVLRFLLTPDNEGVRTATIKVTQRVVKPKDGTDPRIYNDVKSVDCDIINGARIADFV